MGLRKKPKQLEVAGGGCILEGPLVGAEAIVAGSYNDVTVRLERSRLKSIWKIDSDRIRTVRLRDDLIVVGGPRGAGVRRMVDGRLLWLEPSEFGGSMDWGPDLLVVGSDAIAFRDLLTGKVIRTIAIPGGRQASGGKISGDMWVQQSGRFTVATSLESGETSWMRDARTEMEAVLGKTGPDDEWVRLVGGSGKRHVIAMNAGNSFGCSRQDGAISWHVPVWAPSGSWPTSSGGVLYMLLQGRLVAVDEDTGRILFDRMHSALERSYHEKAGTVYRNRLAISTETGQLGIFDLADGSLVNLYSDKLPLWQTAEADGRLLVGTGDGKLLVFDESIWGL